MNARHSPARLASSMAKALLAAAGLLCCAGLAAAQDLKTPVSPGAAIAPGAPGASAASAATPEPATPGPAASIPAPAGWILRTTPLRVEARLLHEEPAGPFASRQYVFAISVRATQGEQVLTTAVSGNSLDEALKTVRAGTVWRAPYLFVHIDRGTGTRADSSREAVFEISDGRIRSVGQLVDRGEAPASYHGRRFVDYWGTEPSQFARLCHGCVPVLTVALADRNGKLEVRRGATWSANQDQWQANAAIIAQPPRASGPGQDSDAGFTARLAYFQAVVRNAVLAKYVWKPTELNQLLVEARPYLNPEQRADLQEILDAVSSLTPPSEARASLYALNVGAQTDAK